MRRDGLADLLVYSEPGAFEHGGVLYLVVGTIDAEEYAAARRRGSASPAPRGKRICAVDAATGKGRWTFEAEAEIVSSANVAGDRVDLLAPGATIPAATMSLAGVSVGAGVGGASGVTAGSEAAGSSGEGASAVCPLPLSNDHNKSVFPSNCAHLSSVD